MDTENLDKNTKKFSAVKPRIFLANVIIVFWLLAWYIIDIWLVLGSLTSYQLQQSISSGDPTEYTVSSVVRLLNERDQIQDKLDEITASIAKRENELKALYVETRLNEQAYLSVWGKFLIQEPEFIETGKESITIIHGLPYQSGYLNCYKVLEKEKVSDTDANRSYEICQTANTQWYELQSKKTLLTLRKIAIRRLGAEQDEQKQSLDFLLQNNQPAKDYLTQLSYMSKFLFDRLATMPIQLLTLILTLSMGSLGSLIFLTQNLVENRQQIKFVDYLFHPLLGMVMAIAIFILAKSGQLVAVNSDSSDAINLNPFFVSFVAIISGVLSKQAYDKIYQTGKAFFEQGETQSRWAIGVTKIMEKRNKKVADLEPYIDQKREVINDWLSGTKAVPEEYQTLIAIWLGMEKRKIFTDLK